ncbi:MAG: YqeG family HAD IIIA-type phosphatase [Bacillota bacterium]|mgnify:CR=1 FL=1|nr:YqeG family HAD IIIA-type phosphatase [Candidatus Fermentithermobacillaceae bacterium]
MSDNTRARRSIRQLLTPSLYVETVYDLPGEWLKERAITSIITDLDNTLVPWRDYRVAGELADWFDSLHKSGYKTLILTNARPAPTIQELSRKLNTKLVVGAGKPVTRFFRKALEILDSKPHQTCVIGDQLFTDVLGGNLVGCHTVLVERIGHREFVGTRIMRLFERLVKKRMGTM